MGLSNAPLVNPSRTAAVLQRFGFRLSRDLGQNFLIDPNTLRKIVDAADLSRDDIILEIGAGIGTLTEALASLAGHVTTVEIDKKLTPVLDETLAGLDNITILNKDAMDLKPKEVGFAGKRANKFVANLPYGIAAPLLLKILSEFANIDTGIAMVQKEIADRIMAKPGSKNYSSFTVKLQYFSRAKSLLAVSRHVFMPAPNVDSAVIRLDRLEKPPVKTDREKLFSLISAGFSQRRKQLANALSSTLNIEKAIVEAALKAAGLPPNIRAENLTLTDFASLGDSMPATDKYLP